MFHVEIEAELTDEANVGDTYRVAVSVGLGMFEKQGRSNDAQKCKHRTIYTSEEKCCLDM